MPRLSDAYPWSISDAARQTLSMELPHTPTHNCNVMPVAVWTQPHGMMQVVTSSHDASAQFKAVQIGIEYYPVVLARCVVVLVFAASWTAVLNEMSGTRSFARRG